MFKSITDYDYRRGWVFACCIFLAIGCTQTLAEGQNLDPGLEAEQNAEIPTPEELEPFVSKMAKWPALYDCGPTTEVLAVVTGKYGEEALVVGMGLIQIPNGQLLRAPVLVYLNAETKSFSLVSHFENGFSCIMTSGQDLQPASRGGPKRIPKKQADPKPKVDPGTYKYSNQFEHKINVIKNDNLDFLVLR